MRNTLVILILSVLFSCKTSESTNGKKVMSKDVVLQVVELRSGQNSGFSQATNKVITTQKELNEVWAILFANYMKKDAAPEVDFKVNMLILVADGEKNSGGYSIKVNKAVTNESQTLVSVLHTSPGKNCITTEAITYPFQLVQIKKTSQKVVFDDLEKIIDCESE